MSSCLLNNGEQVLERIDEWNNTRFVKCDRHLGVIDRGVKTVWMEDGECRSTVDADVYQIDVEIEKKQTQCFRL